MAHAVDLFVNHRLLFNVGVRSRDVGFGLVIVVIADEVFHGVFGKKPLELPEQLRGERLVRGQHDRGALSRFDDLGHREGFAGARRSEQHLTLLAFVQAADKFIDRGRLVAGRPELRAHREFFSTFKLRPNLRRAACR